jgi:hypothetical protein
MNASAHALVTVLVVFFALFSGAEVADWLREARAGGLATVAEALLLSPLFAKAANTQLGAHTLATADALSGQVEAFNKKFTAITTARSAARPSVMRARGTAAILDTLVDSLPSSFIPSLRWFDLAGVWHLVSAADAHLYELPALLAALGSPAFGVHEVQSTQLAVAALETAVRALIEASCGKAL